MKPTLKRMNVVMKVRWLTIKLQTYLNYTYTDSVIPSVIKACDPTPKSELCFTKNKLTCLTSQNSYFAKFLI